MSGISVGNGLSNGNGLSVGSGLSAGGGLYSNGFNSPVLNLNFTTGVLDSRITFSRPSNATYYDSTGKLTYAPNNLSLYSQEFDNAAWAKAQATVSANSTTAPDGTLTADTLLDTAVSNIHYINQFITSYAPIGKTFVVSTYAKANTLNYATVGVSDISTGANYAVAVFNLSNGTVSTSGVAGAGYVVSSPVITSVGNGWYRCSVVCTVGSSAPFLTTIIGVNKTGIITGGAGGLESYLGNGSGIYIWGDQTEIVTYQTTPSTYIATTSAAYYGPRFDYNPTTLAANGLLIEEARTNLLTYSEQFDNASWVKVNGTITANSTFSPDGTLNADTLVWAANTNSQINSPVVTISTGSPISFSCYFKSGTKNSGTLIFFVDGSNYVVCSFNLTNGTVGTPTVAGTKFTSVVPTTFYVGNGWYRCILSCSTNNLTSLLGLIQSDAAAAAGDTIYLWGAQIEVGAFATSYIPTAASSVARSADAVSMTGTNFSSWYTAAQGTFTAVIETQPSLILVADDGGYNNRLPQMGVNALYGLDSYIVAAGSIVASAFPPTAGSAGAFMSYATTYSAAGLTSCTNGGPVATSAVSSYPSGVANLRIGAFHDGSGHMNGHIKYLRFYNKRLSNAQLQSLTT